jgi:hypothetical protein
MVTEIPQYSACVYFSRGWPIWVNHFTFNRLPLNFPFPVSLAFTKIIHVARHTFATVALTHGMSIDSVAKMLGHSNTDMTRHYARVLDAKVSSEMNQLRAVFDKKAS